MDFNRKTIKEQRVKLVHDMDAIINNAKEEKRNLNAEEQKQWDDMYAKEAELRNTANTLKKQDDLNKSLAAQAEAINPKVSTDETEARNAAFEKYVKRGMKSLNSSERNLMEFRGTDTQIKSTGS